MKRTVDIFVAALALFVLAPLFLMIAVATRISLGSPVLFRQVRPGLHEKPFTMLKFRTMRDIADGQGAPLSDTVRLTRLGSLLRKTSLDELPELVNVLRGDMSLVGPRPLLVQYLPYYTQRERLRHSVRPGITGWAQVNGRNHSSWDDRLAHDVWYVENTSLSLDLRILARTLVTVIGSSGVVVAPRELMDDLNVERVAMETPRR